MYNPMTHASDLTPGNRIVCLLKFRRYLAGGLSNGLDEMREGKAKILIFIVITPGQIGYLINRPLRHVEHVADVDKFILLHTRPRRFLKCDPVIDD